MTQDEDHLRQLWPSGAVSHALPQGTCETCHFCFKASPHDWQCRRWPPRIIGAMIPECMRIESESGSKEHPYLVLRAAITDASCYPLVSDEDWCGEWRATEWTETA